MSVIKAAFKILDDHPRTDWFDSYVILFNECARLGLKDYSRKIFYNMMIEAIRSDESWFFEEFISDDGECAELLKELQIFEFTERVTEITKTKREKKFKKDIRNRYKFNTHMAFKREERLAFRRNAQKHLCACCHPLCIGPEELRDIDERDLDYVKGLFLRAVNEEKRDHRQYLCNRILWRIFDKASLEEILDMWLQAQTKGVWVDAVKSSAIVERFESEITKEENFLKILRIVSCRERENDSFIGNILEVLLKEGKFDKAFYLSSKITSAKERVSQVLSAVFSVHGFEKEKIRFLEKLEGAVSHETF